MGALIDTKNIDGLYRCNHVKIPIIFINLIGSPLSFIILLVASIRIIISKNKLTYLTNLILVILISEIINTISKMLQLIKYLFDDERDNTDPKFDSPRGIICQIQIATSIYSDISTLLTSLLISLRCYDVIKNKESFLDKGKREIISIIIAIFIPIILSITLLFIDRFITRDNNISYRYDVRDTCSYWCWLQHITSLICFGFYVFFLLIDIYFTCKTNYFLKNEYKKLLEDKNINIDYINKINSNRSNSNSNSMNSPLNEISKDNSSKNDSSEEINKKIINFISKEEKKRIEELRLMRIKCLIYPFVTIIIWGFISLYRFFDDILMIYIDRGNSSENRIEYENDYFDKHFFVQIFYQILLVIHTFLSTIRGILYGFCFIIFEEKIFFNFFRNYFMKPLFIDDNLDEDDDEDKKILSNSNSCISDNKEENEKIDYDSKSDTIEMNSSDYNYNEK